MTASLPYRFGRHVVVCQVSGQAFYDDEVIRRYDGAIVARKYNDPQHPQELARVRPERPARPPLSPEPPDRFVSGTDSLLLESVSELEVSFLTEENGSYLALENGTA